MKNYTVCIFDKDPHYAKAFMKAVALEHDGFDVVTRSVCGDNCKNETDACIAFGNGGAPQDLCEKVFTPGCGKYAGVTAILSEVKRFLLDSSKAYGTYGTPAGMAALLCVHAYAGGLGTSCAAIGIGREFARYRGEQVLYLSLEDVEAAGLFPRDLRAMRAEEALYRFLRLLNSGAGQERIDQLFLAAFARDEYGLYRLAPDEGAGSLAGLGPEELYMFLERTAGALGLARIVLDFGTRLYFLKTFAAFVGRGEAIYVEACREAEESERKRHALPADERILTAVFPVCEEDVRRHGRYTDVGISNAFGLAVKEVCDRIAGDAI